MKVFACGHPLGKPFLSSVFLLEFQPDILQCSKQQFGNRYNTAPERSMLQAFERLDRKMPFLGSDFRLLYLMVSSGEEEKWWSLLLACCRRPAGISYTMAGSWNGWRKEQNYQEVLQAYSVFTEVLLPAMNFQKAEQWAIGLLFNRILLFCFSVKKKKKWPINPESLLKRNLAGI